MMIQFNMINKLDDLSASPEERLAKVKTVSSMHGNKRCPLMREKFILLELYGLCSGDKRSYEFVEAFHGNLISVCPQTACTTRRRLT